MSMLGLRDLVLIAPTPSLHSHQNQGQPISSDHNSKLLFPSSASLSVGFGIFPLLTDTPCMPNPQNNDNVVVMESQENGAEFSVCQDCGNRAKKDCVFRRCRTCCKGRGYDCTTHVRSTWVPSVRRREREMTAYGGEGGGSGCNKRLRPFMGSSSLNASATSHSSNSNATTTPNIFATSSPHQDGGFKESLPRQVHAPAVFRCHRVSAIGNGEDEVAYLATVHISGHVFKGFLYDHGVGAKNGMPCVSELQLGNNCSGKNVECSSVIGVPTNNAYPASAT